MPEHDPLKFSSEFSAKLATRSRHVCIFLGAGSSRACGLPDISQLRDRVLARLDEDERARLLVQLNGRNLEEALSRLRRIAALVTDDQKVDGLTGPEGKALDTKICQAIVKELDIGSADLLPACRLAAWAGHAGYRLPIEIFTVNYDLLLETALDSLKVPYFDGFVGILKARFHIELVENAPGLSVESVPAFFVRLWKLHGSVNWGWEGDQQIVRLGQPVEEGVAAAIYPSDEKYEESRRVPFVVLQDRLRRALHQPETLVIITGYSFGDAHLNELIFDAASRRERSEFVVFCYGTIPQFVANRAISTPNVQVVNGHEAILGGVRGTWKAPEENVEGLWEDSKFALHDFAKLASHLARSAARAPDAAAELKKLVEGMVAKSQRTGADAKNG